MKLAYLDIETDYVGKHTDERLFRDYGNHRITVIGVRVMEQPADEFVQLVGTAVSKDGLLHILAGVQTIVTYNGRSIPDRIKQKVGFDFPVIAAQLGIVLDREFQHKDLVPECWERGLYGGQKKVEETLGLKRTLPGKDGKWATEAWREYRRTGAKERLEELLLYNREDVFMLREIEKGLQKR
ncbi:MAG TPA: ribonuclease H-like domain-containing protein [Candidatus Acidoferrales bacterium]|nr:ribonuclease H-like domain-containing protein [Candidatus Acidoferrales bacterium]